MGSEGWSSGADFHMRSVDVLSSDWILLCCRRTRSSSCCRLVAGRPDLGDNRVIYEQILTIL